MEEGVLRVQRRTWSTGLFGETGVEEGVLEGQRRRRG